MIDKKQYLQNQAWLQNEFLVMPYRGTATKKCKLCKQVKFTVWFLDNKQFTDWKIPVCTNCLKKHDGKGREIVNLTGNKMECKKCKQEKLLGSFQINSRTNKLDNRCLDCERTRLKALRN